MAIAFILEVVIVIRIDVWMMMVAVVMVTTSMKTLFYVPVRKLHTPATPTHGLITLMKGSWIWAWCRDGKTLRYESLRCSASTCEVPKPR